MTQMTKLAALTLAALLASATTANAAAIATLTDGETLTGTFNSFPFTSPIASPFLGAGFNLGFASDLGSSQQLTINLFENVDSTVPFYSNTIIGITNNFDALGLSGWDDGNRMITLTLLGG